MAGCPSAEEGNVQWPGQHACEAASHPCVKYHPLFKGGSVVRECSSHDETLQVDFSNCSVLQSDFNTPFAVVWLTLVGRGSSGSAYVSDLPTIKRRVSRVYFLI